MIVLFRLVCAALLLGAASSLHASPKLNGMAIYSPLAEDQFIAAVYSETLTREARELLLADEHKVMEIRVLTDTLYARRFKRMWIEGIAINAGAVDLEKHAQHLADFSNFLRVKMKANDVLRIERISGTGTRLSINGQELGVVPSERFFDLLLRTWIGPVPLSSDFKQALLAGGDVPDGLKKRFSKTSPSRERIAEVTLALQTAAPPQETSSPEKGGTETAPATKSIAQSPNVPAPSTPPVAVVKKPTPTAPAEPAKPAKPVKPAAPAKEEGLVSEDALFADESLFSDEDQDFAFTAEGLLSEQVYISKLTKWTSSSVNYPRAAIKNNQQGTVRLTVTLWRNGKVKDVQFLEKSEYEYLNRAAAKAVSSASPYPAVPDAIKGDTFLFTVPVVFRLN